MILLSTLILAEGLFVHGWVALPSAPGRTTTPVSSSKLWYTSKNNRDDDNDGSSRFLDSDDGPQRRARMQVVRSLQSAFYQSSEKDLETSFQGDTMTNLKVWAPNWTEVPGRTNVWKIHEPQYTHMLESIVRKPQPWYVGHVAPTTMTTKNSSKALLTEEDTPLLGTLMRIVDYRRMNDGKLLVLVQGLERLVVQDIVQSLPFPIANVQLVPDIDEIDDDDSWMETCKEDQVRPARAMALAESRTWRSYEFEATKLPLPEQTDLAAEQVVGSALAQVLPYAPFGESLPQGSTTDAETVTSSDEVESTHDSEQTTLEHRLLHRGILRQPAYLDHSLLKVPCDELERQVWVALDAYLKKSRTPVSPVLLGFLPVGVKWPPGFLLEKIGNAIEKQTTLDSKYVRLSPSYPATRRQKRLSFSVPYLLEDTETVNEFRREILATPSTKERLVYVLQLLQDEGKAFQ